MKCRKKKLIQEKIMNVVSHVLLPYALRKPLNSDDFYRKAEDCADYCLNTLKPSCNPLLPEYFSYIKDSGIEPLRSEDEYFIEIVIAGVFFARYLDFALGTSTINLFILDTLTKARRFRPLKKIIDSLRGILITRKFMPRVSHLSAQTLTLRVFRKLIHYLESTGDFTQESARLENWYRFLKSTRTPVEDYYAVCIRVAAQFSKKASSIFETYTSSVDNFIDQQGPYYHDREDILFCTRPRAEYHLNIVCAEILNRAFRHEFNNAPKKIVLLPTCMRKSDAKCMATPGREKICAKCDPDCTICRITKECEKHGVDTRLIPHSSDFSDTLRLWQNDKSFGLVGIACILNLLRGGYEMRALGIPSQCVFLDWGGCAGHWSESGIPTDINMSRLLHILAVESAQ